MSLPAIPSTIAGEDVRRTVLDNGLVVLTKELHTSPIVTSMIWYRVGSRNEELGQTGKSHFLEHMLFKGTNRFKKGQIDLLTLKNGGSNNAFTSQDFTAYYFNFASDRWNIALEIEADRMLGAAVGRPLLLAANAGDGRGGDVQRKRPIRRRNGVGGEVGDGFEQVRCVRYRVV